MDAGLAGGYLDDRRHSVDSGCCINIKVSILAPH